MRLELDRQHHFYLEVVGFSGGIIPSPSPLLYERSAQGTRNYVEGAAVWLGEHASHTSTLMASGVWATRTAFFQS
jgi:hypothetical protein